MDMMDDHDPVETQEWVDSIKAVLRYGGLAQLRLCRVAVDVLGYAE
jgi:pyruvate dehydrogenase complex dehydrogenase (E1) component